VHRSCISDLTSPVTNFLAWKTKTCGVDGESKQGKDADDIDTTKVRGRRRAGGRHPSPICAPPLPTCHCGLLASHWRQYLSYYSSSTSQSHRDERVRDPGKIHPEPPFAQRGRSTILSAGGGDPSRERRAQDAGRGGRGDLCLRSVVVRGHARPRLRPRLAPCRPRRRRRLHLLFLRAPGRARRRRADVAAPPSSRRLPAPASVAAVRERLEWGGRQACGGDGGIGTCGRRECCGEGRGRRRRRHCGHGAAGRHDRRVVPAQHLLQHLQQAGRPFVSSQESGSPTPISSIRSRSISGSFATAGSRRAAAAAAVHRHRLPARVRLLAHLPHVGDQAPPGAQDLRRAGED
jgi:hypothetical protein